MKVALLAMALALNAAPASAVEDNHAGLTLHSKAAIATALPPHRSAPYTQPLGEAEREPLFTKHDVRHEQSRSSCESGRDLCYDNSTGRVVYKPARQLMPDLPGLQAENISLKRDRIVFKYTF